MFITVNIYYHGADGSARRFAEEMTASGTVDAIRAEPGNLRYEYFVPLAGGETVLLIDSWEDQQALDAHHASPMMSAIAALREMHDVRMTVERYVTDEAHDAAADRAFVRE
ncbi:antibiotic biosynthesis monooxygenase [Adlercreutzia muris]|uniref:Antibiotic biosynthesis monooxygenase n=1 Tax=Adlercreutzia muris TaxID=1796610 RepID=A0A7C8BT71_9ACTN|nr:antibiotic biosynthesis monooxygenase [Adlercreutzia muris]